MGGINLVNDNASADQRFLYDKDWIHLIALAKQSGLSTTDVRLFLEQKTRKKPQASVKWRTNR